MFAQRLLPFLYHQRHLT
ncbi:hypothetical protein MXB_2526 [Myxobolus squamalis]|nr:hypothetical protein MXB_2526 [Myxobolus squamalis]